VNGRISILAILGIVVGACGTSGTTMDAGPDADDSADPFDVPIRGLDADQLKTFNTGDGLFDTVFRDYDGLGPLYIRQACSSCHASAVRGPGFAQKMAIVLADGFTPAPDQSSLAWGHTVRPFITAGAKTALLPPMDPTVKVSIRLGMPLLGHGYMEAVASSEMDRVAAEQAMRPDAIKGKVNHVVYVSEENPDTRFFSYKKGDPVYGRFGVKARQPTLDDFVADALQGDIGITTPMRPTELANPDNLADDLKPGVDLSIDFVNTVATYLRTIAIPKRVGLTDRGKMLFEQVGCAVCHQPTMKTRADYPIPQLANIDAPIYTDMLLHHWNSSFGDGMTDGEAESTQWRTAPLIGLRFNKTFLHDGSASSVEGAIVSHSGEASETAQRYMSLPSADHKTLLDFVSAL
jgi:CxxC motif-containing protein (DUF1111 family)